ncbi:MAG: hypothetical protein ACI9R3_000498 [Verrucomicrobiales bacterium]|jgi:hypothetical protein
MRGFQQDKLDLFVFVDALGWRIVEEYGFMSDALPNQQSCDTIFGYSSACDPSILTGKLPQEHGHFSCFVKAPSKAASPFSNLAKLGWLPEAVAGHPRIRNRVSSMLARKLEYTGYFQLYSVPFSRLPYLDYTEKYDIYAPGGIISGDPTVFSQWQASGMPWFRSDWHQSDDTNIAQIREKIDAQSIALGYLFTSGLDAAMHRHGTKAAATEAAIRKLEKQFTDLLDLARDRYEEVRFHVFSDHGMTDTVDTSDLMPRWEKETGLRYGEDYVAVWDSTMARFWFDNDLVEERAIRRLEQENNGSIVTKNQLKRWGCDFKDNRYGELFFLLDPGALFVPSYMNQRFVTGMHGYTPEHADSKACWLTNAHIQNHPESIDKIFDVMVDSAGHTPMAAAPFASSTATARI